MDSPALAELMTRSLSVKSLRDLDGPVPLSHASSPSLSMPAADAKVVRRWTSAVEFRMALDGRGHASSGASKETRSQESSPSPVSVAAESLHISDAELCLSAVPEAIIPLLKPASVEICESLFLLLSSLSLLLGDDVA